MNSGNSATGQSQAFLVEEEWINALPVLRKLKELGGQKYFETIPNISRALQLKDKNLRCIDEGTIGGIHLAGSGILLNLDQAISFCQKAEIKGVYSHAECGAAKIYAKKESLDPAEADEFGIEWAKTLAEKLKIPYLGHLEISQMARSSGLHTAVAVYYDGTGEFDCSQVAELPKGFIISRRYLDSDYAKLELKMAIEIALGSHGFGQKFSIRDPFIIVVLAKNDPDSKKFLLEAKEVAKKFGPKVLVTPFLMQIKRNKKLSVSRN
jgi:hypothetical protein